jgi:hypothetical protein
MLVGAAVGALLLQATISGVILLSAAAVALAAGIFLLAPAPSAEPEGPPGPALGAAEASS